ncbi:MAG: tetratricopeptide repeat protein [Myxococcota bacterium]
MTPAPDALIGRARNLEELESWLPAGGVVTIVGTAGIGKSRVARALFDAHKGEKHLVALAGERSPEGCAAKVARSLQLQAGAGAADIARALEHRRDALLVLDDADHAVEALAQLLPEWTERAHMAILVASRERLRLRRERAYELGPLAEEDALALLRQRIRQSAPHAMPHEEQLRSLARWLEGIPLAIELAAARAPLLPQEPSRSRVDVLRGGFRDGADRHTTLRDALDWSWELLDEDARTALAELSVFGGLATIADAEAVLTAPEANARLDVLQRLIDKSFVRSVDGGLRLFDAVREFAAEKLEDADDILRRLDTHLAAQANARGEVSRIDILAAADRIVRGTSRIDTANAAALILAACRLLLSTGPAAELITLASKTHHQFRAEGSASFLSELRLYHARGLRMLGELGDARTEAAAALAEHDLPAALRAELLTEMGLASHAQRDLGHAEELYQRALAASAERKLSGRLHANLGSVAHDRGDLETAETSYRSALVSLRVTGDARLLGVVRCNLALVLQERGDLRQAVELFERGLAELAQADEQYLGSIHRSNLGSLLLEQGEPAKARALHDEALTYLRWVGDDRSIVLCLCRRVAALSLQGEVAQSEADLEEASSLARGAADPLLEQVVSVHRAFPILGRAKAAEDDARGRELTRCRRALQNVEDALLSDDARAALRVLRTQLGNFEPSTPASLDDDALIVTIEARFFRAPNASWEDLQRFTSQRRLLAWLVDAHDRRPEAAFSISDLQRAVWPGERIRRDAAKNRIHVTLSKLRGRGLKKWIQRTDEGYRLDPSLPVVQLATTTPP